MQHHVSDVAEKREGRTIARTLDDLATERKRLEEELETVKRLQADAESSQRTTVVALEKEPTLETTKDRSLVRKAVTVEDHSSGSDEVADARDFSRDDGEEQPPAKRARIANHSDGDTVNHNEVSSSASTARTAERTLGRSTTEPDIARPVLSPGTTLARSRTIASIPGGAPGANLLVWLDFETNNAILKPEETIILAIRVSNKNYEFLDEGLSLLVHWPNLSLEQIRSSMPDVVQKMHEKSGLLREYNETPTGRRLTLKDVDVLASQYLQKHAMELGRGILAGSGIGYDRQLVRVFMPKLDALLTHQIFDTTSLWHFIRLKYNRPFNARFSTTCAHRAMDDIKGSLREAKTYSELVLKPPGSFRWPNGGYGI